MSPSKRQACSRLPTHWGGSSLLPSSLLSQVLGDLYRQHSNSQRSHLHSFLYLLCISLWKYNKSCGLQCPLYSLSVFCLLASMTGSWCGPVWWPHLCPLRTMIQRLHFSKTPLRGGPRALTKIITLASKQLQCSQRYESLFISSWEEVSYPWDPRKDREVCLQCEQMLLLL